MCDHMCGGDQVSLDCNDPEGAVFTCVATNRATQQQASLQQAAPQLPYPWAQLVDQNGCWSEVASRLEGDSGPSARVTSLKAQGTLMHPGVQPTARQPQKAPHKCSLLRAASIKYEELRTRHFAPTGMARSTTPTLRRERRSGTLRSRAVISSRLTINTDLPLVFKSCT